MTRKSTDIGVLYRREQGRPSISLVNRNDIIRCGWMGALHSDEIEHILWGQWQYVLANYRSTQLVVLDIN